MSIKNRGLLRGAALLAAGLTLAACDLSVTNPGPLPDASLNEADAMPGLVTGMSADLSYALGDMAEETSVIADELSHSGNYADEGLFYRGIVPPENVNDDWADMQRARWVAETGIQRLQKVLGADYTDNPLTTRAYIYMGYANRLLGENVCQAVIDGGPAQAYTVHFERADSAFSQALALATAQGDETLATTALAGRASVRADLGRWADAVADAKQVPTDFEYDAIFSLNTERENNDLAYETQTRREFSVYNTQWASNSSADPRVPWDTVLTSGGKLQTGQDGKTPFFQQEKYPTLASNIPLSKGTEMLLIRAEAALRDGDVASAVSLMNDERAAYGLQPIAAATPEAAWTALQKERGAVLWLEARRLYDLRRWYADTGAAHNDFLNGRDKCIPVSQAEAASNPNI